MQTGDGREPTKGQGEPTRPRRRVRPAVWLGAAFALLVLAVPLLLVTPWAKAFVLGRATAWVRGRYGIDVRAGRFDYRLPALAIRLDDLTAAYAEAPDRPFLRIAQLDVDLSAAALRGRLAFDRISLVAPSVVLDSTTRPEHGLAEVRPPDAAPWTLPAFDVGALEVRDLDVVAGDEHAFKAAVRGLSASLRGTGPNHLEGDLDLVGGLDVTFGTEAFALDFDRADARVTLRDGTLAVAPLTASSRIGQLEVEGTLTLEARGRFDLRYQMTGQLEELRRWWRQAPRWAGQASLKGHLGGTLGELSTTFDLRGTDLAWAPLASGTLQASGQVSSEGLDLRALSLVAPQATLDAKGTMAFARAGRSSLSGQWGGVSLPAFAGTVSVPATAIARSVGSGSAALAWTGPLPTLGTLEGRVETTVIGLGPDEAAVGRLTADGRDRRWHVTYRQALAGDTRAALDGVVDIDGDNPARSPLAGPITLGTADLGAALTQLSRLGLDLPALPGELRSGPCSFTGMLTGTLATPKLDGQLSVASLRIGTMTDLDARGTVGLDRRALQFAPLIVESSGNRAVLQGTLPWERSDGAGRFDVQLARPDALASTLPDAWRPSGTLELSGEWSGTARRPRVAAQLTGTDLQVNGITFDTVSGAISFEEDTLRVADLQLVQPGGSLRAVGSWNLKTSTLNGSADGSTLGLWLLVPDAAGTLASRAQFEDVSFEVQIDGPMSALNGAASMTAGSALVAGRPLGAVDGRVEVTAGVARITASARQLGASLEGAAGMSAPWPYEGRLSLRGTDLAELARLAGIGAERVDGVITSLDASIDAKGTLREPSASSVTVGLVRLDGQVRGRPLVLSQPGQVRVEDRAVRLIEPLRLSVGSLALGVSSSPSDSGGGPLVVTLDGPLQELTSLEPAVIPTDWTVDGNVKAKLLVGEPLSLANLSGQVTADLTTLQHGEQRLAQGVRLEAQLEDGTLGITEVVGTVLGSPLTARATLPLAWAAAPRPGLERTASEPRATFSLQSTVAVGPLLAALGYARDDISGTAGLIVEGSASAPRLEAVEATLRQDGGALLIRGVEMAAKRVTELRLADGRLHVDTLDWQGPRSEVRASGTIGLLDGVEGRLDLEGRTALRLLDLLLPGRADGSTVFDLEVSGTRDRRQVLGTLVLNEASLILPQQRLALAEWSGTLVLDADGIAVSGLRGQFNGGDVGLNGRLAIAAAPTSASTLGIEVRNVFFEFPRGLRSQLDATLTWSGSGGRARLTGTATVSADVYREPVTALAAMVSGLARATGGSVRALPGFMAGTELDIRLATAGPLALSNSVARVELVPDLRLTGTIGRPLLEGQVAVADDGRIQVGGRMYRLRDSRVDFRPGAGLVPRLNLAGETRVGDYTVFLRLSGPADEVATSLSSDPPLGERDIQSLLVTGQMADASASGQADRFAVAAVSGDVLGFAGQFLGLDSVRVGTFDDLKLVSSDVNPATRLTVSKRLGANFEIVLSDNIDDNEFTWVLVYRPRPGYELRFLSRDNVEASVEFRQEIAFGPGVSPRRQTAPGKVRAERVDRVTVSGDPGFAASEVLSVTRLGSGERFDFRRWVEDRERIARLYMDRGFFATRVVPTRRPVEAAGSERRVALDYRIARGPRTMLLIDGYKPRPEVVDRLRQAWSESVLVDLLDDDLASVLRDHLVDAGYLRSGIDVTVERPTSELVVATIRVEPGPLTTSRRLRFSGNAVVPSEALLAVATPGRLDAVAWKDPAPLLDAIEAEYASRGYVAAEATAGDVEFSNGVATMPISIAEGPQARVTALTVTGVDPARRADAISATGLAVGSVYAARAEQQARLGLERYYRELGYRDVEVDSRTTIDTAQGAARVTVAVREGPRYIVRNVRTAGIESTREDLVERAVAIEPGSPASPAAASAMQRRLYDIGTFRSAEVEFQPVEDPPAGDTVPVDAVVSLQESRRYLFLYGVETTSEYQPSFDQRLTSAGVAADVRDRNFLGRGWAFGGGFRYEPRFKSVRTLFSVPTLGQLPVRTNVYATFRREDDTSTKSFVLRDDESALTFEQRWRPRRTVELSWGYAFDYRDLRLLFRDTGQTLFDFKGILASANAAVVFDRRDSMFDATRGWIHSTSVQWGLRALGSNFDYLRTLVRVSHYQPVGPLTLASNVRWGNLEPLGGTPPLTALDLFFTAGGTQTVRGYKQDSLSAYELFGTSGEVVARLGGTRLLVFNEEVRFPMFWLLSGAVFADAGNTFTDERGIVLGDLAVGVGFGLRIRTPLAPLRIDIGFPVPRRPGDPMARWHLSIGQIF